MTDSKMTPTPCTAQDCSGCPVTLEGFTLGGAAMQIEEPKKKPGAPSLQALHALILDGDLTQAERMCDKLQGIEARRYHWLPTAFSYALGVAAGALILYKFFM